MEIGIYSPVDPVRHMPRERTEALLRAAEARGASLVFFDDDAIDLEQNAVDGLVYASEGWVTRRTGIPPAVLNDSPLPPERQSDKARRLAERTAMTTRLIHGKYAVYGMLRESPALSGLIMPTERMTEAGAAMPFLRLHGRIVVKPDDGRQGTSVVGVSLDGENALWQEGREVIRVDEAELMRRLNRLSQSGPFIMQPYQACLTAAGEPFDFRVHVQRDGDGRWSLTKVYPRVGEPGTIVSNLARGGGTVELAAFLRREFPESHPFIAGHLAQLGLEIASYLDGCYPYDLDELGIDLAIDGDGRTWFYEANTSPQTRDHERERASAAISYAIRLAGGSARGGAEERQATAGVSTDRLTVGMLVGIQVDQSFMEACASIALLHGADFFYFHPKNVNVEDRTIRGRVFEGGAWKKRTCPYPDVVYDRFKRRGVAEYEQLYVALDALPFTHLLRSGSMSKERVYQWMQDHPALADSVIPYTSVQDAGTMSAFVDRHRTIVMKPSVGSHGKSIIMIERTDEGEYLLFDQQFLHRLNAREFRTFLEMYGGQGYVAQRFVRSVTKEGYPFHLRVHLMRNGENEWEIVFVQPFLSLSSGLHATNHAETLRLASKWDWFLSSQYGEAPGMEMDQKVRYYGLMAVRRFEAVMGSACHEIALDIGVDEARSLWLFEANFNQIGNTFHGFEAARFAIPYALYLAKQNKSRA
ncbi:YheC/YheD family protein [Cohnella sp. JJ-181]|uniref:YheC/YheD family protein n=1 Tax=Cohnella rhizoplanae TaxID=2974897 RepID=UPI0022FF9EA2|nr:YheC/YheD family protein [Cohnella sp. JJ-181]CAI6083773.1 hypothetical protein COHCIP112018_04116 [Cohnella sp. JJ-181]